MKILRKARIFAARICRSAKSQEQCLYPPEYTYREDPKPRPTSNVSLGEVFAWFFNGEEFLPANPNINEVAQKCRTDPAYSGDRPWRVPWSAERETGHAIYTVIRLLRPINVIEIGIYNGASSISIAQALHDNHAKGHLHCIEIDDYNIELTRRHLEEANIAQRVSFYQGSSHDQTLADRLPQSGFIFIDGDHTYEGARKDFQIYSKKLKPRGIMLYHDTTKIMELRQLIQEIRQLGDFDVFTVATSDGDGITFLRRRW